MLYVVVTTELRRSDRVRWWKKEIDNYSSQLTARIRGHRTIVDLARGSSGDGAKVLGGDDAARAADAAATGPPFAALAALSPAGATREVAARLPVTGLDTGDATRAGAGHTWREEGENGGSICIVVHTNLETTLLTTTAVRYVSTNAPMAWKPQTASDGGALFKSLMSPARQKSFAKVEGTQEPRGTT